MAWDFETEPEFDAKMDWIRDFTREFVEPLDLVHPGRMFHPLDEDDPTPRGAAPPRQVKQAGLWAAHLGPELGGRGFGQVKLALINENPRHVAVGAHRVRDRRARHRKRRDHRALRHRRAEGAVAGAAAGRGVLLLGHSMTEPQGGADPKVFTTRAVREGDEWVINGWKYFSSNARTARFVIVMAVTNPDVSPYQGMSMFLVPTDTPGFTVVRNVGIMSEAADEGMHGLVHYDDVRGPGRSNSLGGEGQAFVIAQTRLGGGRVHHAMRTVGLCQRRWT